MTSVIVQDMNEHQHESMMWFITLLINIFLEHFCCSNQSETWHVTPHLALSSSAYPVTNKHVPPWAVCCLLYVDYAKSLEGHSWWVLQYLNCAEPPPLEQSLLLVSPSPRIQTFRSDSPAETHTKNHRNCFILYSWKWKMNVGRGRQIKERRRTWLWSFTSEVRIKIVNSAFVIPDANSVVTLSESWKGRHAS